MPNNHDATVQKPQHLYFSICASGVGLGVLNHSPLKALMSQLLNSAALVSIYYDMCEAARRSNLLSYTTLLALWK
jgi:hypothetical protein